MSVCLCVHEDNPNVLSITQKRAIAECFVVATLMRLIKLEKTNSDLYLNFCAGEPHTKVRAM